MSSLATLVHSQRAQNQSLSDAPDDPSSHGPYEERHDELDNSEIQDASPPSYLRHLFDDFAIDGTADADGMSNQRTNKMLLQASRARQRPLIPSKDTVSSISQYASDWMRLYHTLCISSFTYRTGDQLVTNYDYMGSDSVHPASLGMYLMCIAITIQQMPLGIVPAGFYQGKGIRRYVVDVLRTVEQTVISVDCVAGTVHGLDTAMLYVRLSLGCGRLKPTWLICRRIIALAELMGLPRANDELTRSPDPKRCSAQAQTDREALVLKADLWENICYTDRNFGMMLDLPAGTARYSFPRDESVLRRGQVSAQAYNYQLSNTCFAISEIDDLYARGKPQAECYEKVLKADHQMRSLYAIAPNIWWHQSEGQSLGDHLVKFWHFYLLARVHLRPGMMNDPDDQYAYSFTACQNACHKAVLRFPGVRSRVPSGFFICRVLDAQAFTAATFLLLSCRRSAAGGSSTLSESSVDPLVIDHVQRLIDCFASVSNSAGADIACEAKVALSSLVSLVQGETRRPGEAETLTLQIPLLGKIHVRSAGENSAEPCSMETSTVPRAIASLAAQRISGNNTHDIFAGYPSVVSATSLDEAYAAAVAPLSWTFEFDNPAIWDGDGILGGDLMALDPWMVAGQEQHGFPSTSTTSYMT